MGIQQVIKAFFFLGLLLACSCAAPNRVPKPGEVEISKEYYQMGYRSHPPETVYSRVMWSHLPAPMPHRSRNDSPLLDPEISFELPNSNLSESVQALAQAVGFRWSFPQDRASAPVSINQVGTVSEILAEICRQANLRGQIYIDERMIVVSAGQ